MFFRQILAIALLLPLSARAQFSLTATQVGLAGPDAESHAGNCSRDACRAIIPVRWGGEVCALNIRVAAPTREGWGGVMFAAGPCQSGRKVAVSPNASETGYTLDHVFAASQQFVVPLQSAAESIANKLIDDGVLHKPVVVRLDIIAHRPQ